MKDKTLLWIGGAGLGALALGYFFRDEVASAAGGVVDAAKEALFKAVIPNEAKPYADDILRVAREKGVSPFLIVGLGMRETRWGNAPQLSQPGPYGRGDGGHGYGLMQIDDRSNANWIATEEWWVPYKNISKGIDIWLGKRRFFSGNGSVKSLTDGSTVTIGAKSATRRGVEPGDYQDPRPLAEPLLTQAATAAYNTGEGNVLMSLAVGLDADFTTAPGPSGAPDYSSDVLGKMASLLDAFNNSAAA